MAREIGGGQTLCASTINNSTPGRLPTRNEIRLGWDSPSASVNTSERAPTASAHEHLMVGGYDASTTIFIGFKCSRSFEEDVSSVARFEFLGHGRFTGQKNGTRNAGQK